MRECISIVCHIEKSHGYSINITGITEEEEELIEKGVTVTLIRDGIKYQVIYGDVYCYGEVDLSPGSSDSNIIEDFNWLKHENTPCYLPAYYDYINHSAGAKNSISRYWYTETFNSARVAKYKHGCIGKPKRILIFKQRHDKR